jgi:predicted dehydrogenase
MKEKSTTMKAAVIGTGRMGHQHIEILRLQGIPVVALCDVQLDSVKQAGAKYGINASACYTDPQRLFGEARPELVVVATTAPSHCDLTCQAAEGGARAILCEKPMAISLAECDRMIEKCRCHDVRLAVNHQMRFMEQYTEPKRITHTEAFGGLRSVAVIAGNFGLAMNGTHYFEMFRYLTDEEPAEVTAWFSPEKLSNPRGVQFNDSGGCVRLTTPTGRRFYLDASGDQGHGFQALYAGRNGQLSVDEATGEMRLTQRERAHRSEPTARYLMPFTITTQTIQPADSIAPTRAVLEALLKGENYPTGEEARLTVHILAAAHISNEQGHRSVPLDDVAIDPLRVFPWA